MPQYNCALTVVICMRTTRWIMHQALSTNAARLSCWVVMLWTVDQFCNGWTCKNESDNHRRISKQFEETVWSTLQYVSQWVKANLMSLPMIKFYLVSVTLGIDVEIIIMSASKVPQWLTVWNELHSVSTFVYRPRANFQPLPYKMPVVLADHNYSWNCEVITDQSLPKTKSLHAPGERASALRHRVFDWRTSWNFRYLLDFIF